VEDYKARDKSSDQILSHLQRIRGAFGTWRAVNLAAAPDAIDRYVNECKQAGMALSTINRGTQLLAQAYKLSIDRKRLTSAPIVRHMPERNARQGFFEDADFKAVADRLPPTCRISLALDIWLVGERVKSDPCYGPTSTVT
jgi:hypothetical protein